MNKVFKEKLKKKLQKIFWIYPCNIFVINGMKEFEMVEPKIKCGFIPITFNNCHRVVDFREEARISEYRDKLARKEIGYFAEYDGKMLGSIWGTINKKKVSDVVRTYIKLQPNEGLIHDIVTSEKSRGLGVGSFMVSRMTPFLLKEYRLSRIIIDVNIRNQASLRMHKKLGFQIDRKMLYVAAFGKLILQLVLKKYA
jgi:ribosomal protein S18 acetylase RimI-like enzyme